MTARAPKQPEAATYTVYVVDDDESIRRLLTWLMEQEGYRVASFATGEAFLDTFRANGPSCLLLDLTLGGMDGLDLQARLKGVAPDLPVVFISATADVPRAVEAVKLGAVDFIVKPFDYTKVLDLVRVCVKRSADALSRRRREESALAAIASLTPRERQVMDQVVAGKLNRVIAEELDVSIKTVEAHRAKIMEKLQVGSVADLVRVAVGAGSRSEP
jgi:two-component system response regulator TtrR